MQWRRLHTLLLGARNHVLQCDHQILFLSWVAFLASQSLLSALLLLRTTTTLLAGCCDSGSCTVRAARRSSRAGKCAAIREHAMCIVVTTLGWSGNYGMCVCVWLASIQPIDQATEITCYLFVCMCLSFERWIIPSFGNRILWDFTTRKRSNWRAKLACRSCNNKIC
jgi:hypothetical protein